MKNRWVSMMAAVALGAALSVATNRPAVSASLPDSLQVGGASIGGAFYVVAGGVAKVLEDNLKIPVTAAVTEGSNENVRLLDRKQVQIGVVAANNAYPAYHGILGYEKKHTYLRALIGLFPNALAYMALPGTPYKSFTSLRNQRVGVGSGKTWDPFMKPLFKAHGMEYNKDFTPVYAGFGDLFTQVGDGAIVATVVSVSGGIPIPGALQLASAKGAQYFGPDPAPAKKVVQELPFMSLIRITKDTPSFKQDLDTVDIGGPNLYVRADMDEELVYRITKLVHQNLGELAKDIRYFQYAQAHPERLTVDNGLPYHPGAIRYWKEAGFWKR
ncbi:MAG: TAXI family TRAP transporter solute-binding subunit [Deltaproteobacteria bacterium]|nr:TAXI family TRAP transporter solute-binding subunit [Deltaproteobacteria bacterium]